jgi:two-component system, NtrC family, response regulator GlrR
MPETRLRRILLADNDEDVLVALERALEDGGYATATALSHEEASKLVSRETFDLCVLDDYLSDKNSIQVLTEFRRAGMTLLVIVTYHRFPSPHDEKQLRALGVNAFVNKRAHSDLKQMVDQLLEPKTTPYRVNSTT